MVSWSPVCRFLRLIFSQYIVCHFDQVTYRETEPTDLREAVCRGGFCDGFREAFREAFRDGFRKGTSSFKSGYSSLHLDSFIPRRSCVHGSVISDSSLAICFHLRPHKNFHTMRIWKESKPIARSFRYHSSPSSVSPISQSASLVILFPMLRRGLDAGSLSGPVSSQAGSPVGEDWIFVKSTVSVKSGRLCGNTSGVCKTLSAQVGGVDGGDGS